MIRLQSLWYRLLVTLLTRGRVRFARGAILLRPELIQVARGARVVLEAGAVLNVGARVVVRDGVLTIGAGAYVGPHVTLVAYTDVVIGPRVLIGERVSIHSEDHGPVGDRDRFRVAPIEIGADAWICAGTVISKGSTIGAGTTIGANSFVRGDIPAGVLAAGAPARVVRTLTTERSPDAAR
jgi:acetyltransferase-like isoleucine patch superfamily enzyme